MNKFNLNEIFEIAEQIERNGADFYRKASFRFEDQPEVKKLLLELAVQEDNHEKTFSKIMKSVISENNIDTDNELAALYLDAVAGQFVFNKKTSDAEINPSMSREDIFDLAILKEKDSIVFYLGIKDILSDEKDKEAVDLIIKEEQRHLVDLRKYSEILKYSDQRF